MTALVMSDPDIYSPYSFIYEYKIAIISKLIVIKTNNQRITFNISYLCH